MSSRPGRYIGLYDNEHISDTFISIVWTDFMMSTSYRYPGQAVLGGVGMLSSNVGQYYYAVKVILLEKDLHTLYLLLLFS